MDDTTITAIRAAIRAELAPLQAQLDEIDRKLDLIPDLRFLHANDTAKAVVKSLRTTFALEHHPKPHDRIPVPD